MTLSIQVIPISNRWIVKKTGAKRASRLFETKEDAIAYGLRMSHIRNMALYVHNDNGAVENKIVPKKRMYAGVSI